MVLVQAHASTGPLMSLAWSLVPDQGEMKTTRTTSCDPDSAGLIVLASDVSEP